MELLQTKLELLQTRRQLIDMQGRVLGYQLQEVELGIATLTSELELESSTPIQEEDNLND